MPWSPNPFMVAEIGANHLGSYQRAIQLIDCAADSGADGVKFQCYQAESMVIDHEYTLEDGPWKGQKLIALYREAQTPFDWFPGLFKHCRSRGVMPFSSVFDGGGLALLEELKCQAYKIASFEIGDIELLRAVAETGKRVLISMGACSDAEAGIAYATATARGADVTMMHCVSAYPADPVSYNLLAMQRGTFSAMGLSDHTLTNTIAVAAVTLGAEVIEKHFTLDDARDDGSPDAEFSIDPNEFANLVYECRTVKAAMTKHSQPTGMSYLKRSLWVRHPIAKGEQFTRNHVGSYRPAGGLAPKELLRVLRSGASRDIKAGEALTEDMLING